MGGIHALIGIGEGLLTVGALAFLYASRPDLVKQGEERPVGGAAIWIVGILIAIGLAFIAPWASSHPDGLERVAEQYGFLETAQSPSYSILPDYLFPGISNEAAATVLAGIIGIVLVFVAAAGVAYARRKRRTSS
jgi:cobalt/nickel transport system permease protein